MKDQWCWGHCLVSQGVKKELKQDSKFKSHPRKKEEEEGYHY
jgi:hypothetical protein